MRTSEVGEFAGGFGKRGDMSAEPNQGFDRDHLIGATELRANSPFEGAFLAYAGGSYGLGSD